MGRVKKLRAELTKCQKAYGHLVCQVGMLEGRIESLENGEKIRNCKKHLWLMSRLYRAYSHKARTSTSFITYRCTNCPAVVNVSVLDLTPQQRKIALAAGVTLPRKKK